MHDPRSFAASGRTEPVLPGEPRPPADDSRGQVGVFPSSGCGELLWGDSPADWNQAIPAVGDDFLGFRLISELGRGAFGRVFLARQGDLADRPVALKVTIGRSAESRSLARLQHTNIVPIYSIHRLGFVQAICMPYFGSTTLRDICQELSGQDALPVSGRGLLTGLYARRSSAWPADDSGPAPVEAGEPHPVFVDEGPATKGESVGTVLDHIEGLSYVHAVLWLGQRLAGGLAHAHGRGILHRDLKPANILLGDDGQPMLLDFNLSQDVKAEPGPAKAIGGTLPYMAPEQLDAYLGGHAALDARSDIYSLGVILHELLTGRRPFAQPRGPIESAAREMIRQRLGPPPELRTWNEAITPAVESIVRHCLEPDPRDRYQSASDLAEDLERHLAHMPLRHAPEPSPRERVAKWVRRHPVASSSYSITLVALILILMLGSVGWLISEELGRADAQLKHASFRRSFEKCQLMLNANGGPANLLGQGLLQARKSIEGYGVGPGRDWTTSPLVSRLPVAEQRALREEMAELILLRVRATVVNAGRGGPGAGREEALVEGIEWLKRAEGIDPRPPRSLYDERSRLYAALGRSGEAADDATRADASRPTSARDYYLIGTALLSRGEASPAEAALTRAVALDPRRFWAWFALGICHSDQGRHADAAQDFGVCTTLATGFAWPYLNRGLALARAGRLQEARLNYDRALEIDPEFAEARADRALTCLELGDPAQALRDLDRASGAGVLTPPLQLARAESLARLGRLDEADRSFADLIRERPRDPAVPVARGYSRLARDPAGSEADFELALGLDPKNARAILGRAYLRRRDRPIEALRLAGHALEIDPAYLDARELRALLRGRLGDKAAESDVDLLIQRPTPTRLYNAACALSLLSERVGDERMVSRGLALLGAAIQMGLDTRHLADDDDLLALRRDPRFPK